MTNDFQMRRRVTFRANFDDDDPVVENAGNVVVPAGHAVMKRIMSSLQNLGVTCSGIEQHSHYGWELDYTSAGTNGWLLLQHPGPWLLIIEHRRSWFSFQNSSEKIKPVLTAVNNALHSSGDFSDIKWFTKASYGRDPNKAGSADPLVE
ncbi:MAG: hypothetical protein SGJ20_04735 [Planctomycetota bacterium]|nr:hypothetical protein [Planctomycetota bacterium]